MTVPSSVDYFRRLGDTVAERWEKRGRDKAVFPEIAEAVMTEMPAHRETDNASVLSHVITTPGYLNKGSSDTFGQPGVPVYQSEHFHVEVLFWFVGTTGIHEHAFQGAFQLLSGSSVHGMYTFDVIRQYTPQFLIGNTRLTHMELLRTGDTRRILPGRAGVHSLFHLDHPSTTVVVRTHNDPAARPQLYFAAPHVAIDGFFQSRSLSLRQRCLAASAQMDPDSLEPMTEAAIANADPIALFMLLTTYGNLEKDRAKRKAFLARMRAKHGDILAAYTPVIEREQLQKEIHRRRADVRDPDQRFFLALLLNCPDRKSVLALATERVPDAPASETVARWIVQVGLATDADVTAIASALANSTPLPESVAEHAILGALAA